MPSVEEDPIARIRNRFVLLPISVCAKLPFGAKTAGLFGQEKLAKAGAGSQQFRKSATKPIKFALRCLLAAELPLGRKALIFAIPETAPEI